MWEYLNKLPPMLSFALLILAGTAVIIISIKGHLIFKWGKAIVGLGDKTESLSETPPEAQKEAAKPAIPAPSATASISAEAPKTRRSCGDCILILMGEREKYELSMRKKMDRLLKLQMNFIEQRLIEIEGMLTDSYTTLFNSMNTQFDSKENYEVEYKLYYGLMRDTLMTIKNELRRCLKENGFYELSDSEFSTYIKDRVQVLTTMITQQLRNLYPIKGVSIPIEKIIDDIEKKRSQLNSYVFEIFVNSKQVVIETDQEIEALKDNFANWVDEFVR